MSYRQIPSTFVVNTTDIPQPLFGSWITAAPVAFTTGPCSAPVTVTLGTALSNGVNDAAMFAPGDIALLVDPSGSALIRPETVRIQSVLNNTVTFGVQTDASYQAQNPVTRFAHYAGVVGTGTFILPKLNINNFLVMLEDGGAGSFLYIGNRSSMTATAYRIFKLAKTTSGTQPQYYSSALYSQGDPVDISELFVYGTANDSWSLSLGIA